MLAATDRVVLITGANRGIGKAVAAHLFEAGYTLSLGAREPAALDGLDDHPRLARHRFDARDPQTAQAWVADTERRFGRIDALVNNAGILHPFAIEDTDETGLDAMWEVNAKGPLRLARAAWPHLRRCGSGRIVNIVSLSGLRVKSAGIGGYAMSKFAAAALTHTLRQAGWADGIRATSICPGYVATDMTREVSEVAAADMIPPEAIAELVAGVLRLPNNAAISELPINCVLEPGY